MKIPREHKENTVVEIEEKKPVQSTDIEIKKEEKIMAKRAVKCPSCGEVIKVKGKVQFNHCGALHSIADNLVGPESPVTPEAPGKHQEAQSKTGSTQQIKVVGKRGGVPSKKKKVKINPYVNKQVEQSVEQPEPEVPKGMLKKEGEWWF